MNVERDPELGRLLQVGLESPVPAPGAEQRVERRLRVRLARTPLRFSRWAFVGAGVLACAAALVYQRRLPFVPARSAALTAPSIAWRPLGRARAALLGKAELRRERDDEREMAVRLVSGTALFHVQKGTGRRFVVLAGESRVEVVGTVFGVELAGAEPRIEVVEGVVRVSEGGTTRTLRAGESSPSGARLFALSPAELDRLRAPFPALELPPSSAIPAPSAPEPEANPHATPETAPVRQAARGSVPPATSRANVSAPPPPVDDAYRQARALERAGAFDGASHAYDAIARGGGAEAEDAAFALVRLPAERGATGAVLAAVRTYRAAFPAGRYDRDVDVFELNAHLARHDDVAARRDANVFLVRYPNDARAWRFHLVRATERAGTGECAGAESELESVPDGPEKSALLASCHSP